MVFCPCFSVLHNAIHEQTLVFLFRGFFMDFKSRVEYVWISVKSASRRNFEQHEAKDSIPLSSWCSRIQVLQHGSDEVRNLKVRHTCSLHIVKDMKICMVVSFAITILVKLMRGWRREQLHGSIEYKKGRSSPVFCHKPPSCVDAVHR